MKTLFALLLVLVAQTAHADSDSLARTSINIPGPHADLALTKTAADMRAVFQRYVPGLDSGSSIVTPLRVTGTAEHPVITVSIKKCVTFICETVDMEGSISMREIPGQCARNFALQIDLSRSSSRISDMYDRLDTTVCFKPNADGSGVLNLDASLHQARNYSDGFMQGQVFHMMELQVAPMTKALSETLRANAK